mgnify:CR=1 FL=1
MPASKTPLVAGDRYWAAYKGGLYRAEIVEAEGKPVVHLLDLELSGDVSKFGHKLGRYAEGQTLEYRGLSVAGAAIVGDVVVIGSFWKPGDPPEGYVPGVRKAKAVTAEATAPATPRATKEEREAAKVEAARLKAEAKEDCLRTPRSGFRASTPFPAQVRRATNGVSTTTLSSKPSGSRTSAITTPSRRRRTPR